MKNVFVCADFNAPHQEPNCSYYSENGEKLLKIIDEGAFNMLSNGYHTYQSFDGKIKYKLDLHFCDKSIISSFNDFQVSDDLGSDHKITITAMNPRNDNIFQLKSKLNNKNFRENAPKLYRSSNLWPANYSKNNE